MEDKVLEGRLIKRHSQFYYVEAEGVLYECMGRAMLKKAGLEPTVGDFVTLDSVEKDRKTARIGSILPRKNNLGRPSVSNADGVLVVCSFLEPAFDFTQTDRYLTHVALAGLEPTLCITKIDLADDDETFQAIGTLYQSLGVSVEFLAVKREGIPASLRQRMKGRVMVLAGPSGSGKSSLLNALNRNLKLRVGEISDKNARGTHTTRHASLLQIDENDSSTLVADTPGFTNLRFDRNLPEEIEAIFADFAPYRAGCAFSDCLHLSETGCRVRQHLDAIAPSRYQSYQTLIEEAREYEATLKKTSCKVERGFKSLDRKGAQSVQILRLQEKNRDAARNTIRQQVNQLLLNSAHEEGDEGPTA
jgi:ribosome biogenesis GTPase / thiamine phosphate phosphatase